MNNGRAGFFTINYLTDALNKINEIVEKHGLKIDDIPVSLLSSILITANYDALDLFCNLGYISKQDVFGVPDPSLGWVLTSNGWHRR